MGFNFCGFGSPNPVYAYAQALKAAGKRTGPFVIINEAPAVAGLASIDPAILTVYRVKGAGRAEPDPRDYEGRAWTGDEWVARWLPALMPGVRANGYLGFKNEVNRVEHIDWYVEFDRQMMNACTAREVHCTYLNSSVGSFKPEHVAKLKPLLVQGQAQGHLLSMNSYWNDDNPLLFWYFEPLVDAVPTVPFILGEVGWYANDARYQGVDALRKLLTEHGKIRHAGYRGGALWCENGAGGGWEHSNIGDDWLVVVGYQPA